MWCALPPCTQTLPSCRTVTPMDCRPTSGIIGQLSACHTGASSVHVQASTLLLRHDLYVHMYVQDAQVFLGSRCILRAFNLPQVNFARQYEVARLRSRCWAHWDQGSPEEAPYSAPLARGDSLLVAPRSSPQNDSALTWPSGPETREKWIRTS